MPRAKATDARSVTQLIRALDSGLRAKYVLFWGHQPSHDGSLSSSCLSQWFHAPFEVGGILYPTAEHYMMAEKARLFRDADAESKVLQAAEPGAAKAIGRAVRGFDEALWHEHRFSIAVRGNLAKFQHTAPLAEFLEGTKKRVLVEASPLDKIWGTGLDAADRASQSPQKWPGLNLLGFALMEARAHL